MTLPPGDKPKDKVTQWGDAIKSMIDLGLTGGPTGTSTATSGADVKKRFLDEHETKFNPLAIPYDDKAHSDWSSGMSKDKLALGIGALLKRGPGARSDDREAYIPLPSDKTIPVTVGKAVADFIALDGKRDILTTEAATFNELIRANPKPLRLEGPASLTIGNLVGGHEDWAYDIPVFMHQFDDTKKKGLINYTKKSLIGGERLIPIAAYQGKRDGVIIQFVERPDEGEVWTLDKTNIVEIPMNKADALVDGFKEYIEGLLEARDDDLPKLKAEKAAQELIDRMANNPNHGSW